MNVRVEQRANRVVLHCAGALDDAGVDDLLRVVETLPREDSMPLVLDLSATTDLSAVGAATLQRLADRLSARETALEPGGPPLLRLANIGTNVQAVLDSAGLTERLGEAPFEASASGRESPHTYRALLPKLRDAFPVPVSDAMHDAYFVQSVARALDRVDQFKNGNPFLGQQTELDYAAAHTATVPDAMSSLETVISSLADYLQGHVIWGHSRTQEQVIPPTTIASVLGQMFAAIYNPNILWDAYSHRIAQAEVELTALGAGLVGYDPARAGGLSTFGGTGTGLYGVKIGVEKAQPGAFQDGVRGGLKLFASDVSHYSRLNIAAWLGLGTSSVVTVPSDNDNSMCLTRLESVLRKSLRRGERIACVIATLGTTDAFGLDNLEAIVRLRDRLTEEYRLDYRPHVHADAVIGWPWAVFNDYDFTANPMGFPARTLRSLWDVRAILRTLPLADSIGLDFHKTGYAPIASSLFLCRDRADLNLISRDLTLMPYLFQFGNHRPGVYTLETSRSGGSVLAALANLKLLGKEGYRVLLGHIVTMAELLRTKLERAPYARIVNDSNHGMVTLFRVYPDGVDANLAYHEEATLPEKADQLAAHNDYNRRVFAELRRQVEQGQGMNLGMTDQYRLSPSGTPIVALKSFVMSPFVDEAAMDFLIDCLERARRTVGT